MSHARDPARDMVMVVTLGIDTITSIVSTMLKEHGRALELVGVTSTEGGSDRVELLITVAGCHKDPCRFMVNVTRGDQVEFERDLRLKLADALASHQRDASLT